MIVCDAFGHLYTTDDIRALHAFATGPMRLKEAWNHCSPWMPHWDLTTKGKREQAWRLGAHRPQSHRENADLIHRAEQYSRTLLNPQQQWCEVLYSATGLVGQPIKRVNYSKMFALLAAQAPPSVHQSGL